MKKDQTQVTWLHRVVSFFGGLYLHLVGLTSLIQKWDDPEFLELRRKKKSIVYAFWHNAQVFQAYAHKNAPASVIVSRSKDGEYIAQVMKYVNLNAVRGSSSRGGEKALREMIGLLDKGEQVGFSPDGPKGPVQTVHGGIVTAAKLSQKPVVPTDAHCRRRLEFNSWDRFVLPLPFSRALVSHGKPFFVPKNLSDEEAREKVRKAINAARDEAQTQEKNLSAWPLCFFARVALHLYNILGLLLIPLWVPALFLKHGWSRSMEGLWERLGGVKPRLAMRKRIWFHAASLGEWQALKPLYEKIKDLDAFDIFITTSTPEAKKILLQEGPLLSVSLLPADFSWIVRRWIKKLDPHAVFIVETELWPSLVRAIYKKDIPLFVVNGRLSKRSVNRWKWIKPLIQEILWSFSRIYARTPTDAKRFQRLGAPKEHVSVVGNLKVDNLTLLKPSKRKEERKHQFGFDRGLILVAGSTWNGEEATLLRAYAGIKGESCRLILAPRRIRRVPKIASLLQRQSHSWTYWSQVRNKGEWKSNILLVDTLGDLKNLYKTADMAFVGGTLTPKGGQNPLEPAAAGLPVLFGPSMDNFSDEANDLVERGGGQIIQNEEELSKIWTELIEDKDLRDSMGQAALNLVQSSQGVADRLLEDLRVQLGF